MYVSSSAAACSLLNLADMEEVDKSAAIHSVIKEIHAVSPPMDADGKNSGVWELSGLADDADGPLVGVLAFPGNPGHVMAFMRMMDGRVLYIDPQHPTHSVTVDEIVFDGVVSTQVAIGLSGPDTRLVVEAIDRLSGAGGAAGGGGSSSSSSSSSSRSTSTSSSSRSSSKSKSSKSRKISSERLWWGQQQPPLKSRK